MAGGKGSPKKSKKVKTFAELAAGRELKAETIAALAEQDYTSTETVATLTPEEIKSFDKITMAQQGLVRKWATELTAPKPTPSPKSQQGAGATGSSTDQRDDAARNTPAQGTRARPRPEDETRRHCRARR